MTDGPATAPLPPRPTGERVAEGRVRGGPRAVLVSVAFVGLLAVWTWKLLEPRPVPEELRSGLAALNLDYLAAKALHATGYATLTVLAGNLPLGRRWRTAVIGFLLLHGVGTEIGQTYVPNRTGKATDVLIDWAGIAAGLWVRRWERRPA